MAAGLRVILQRQYMQKRLLALYLPWLLTAIAQGLILPVLPLYAKSFEASFALVGLVVAGQGIGTLLADLPTSLLLHRFSYKTVAMMGLVVIALARALLFLAPTIHIVLLLCILAGAGRALFFISQSVYVTETVAPRRRGRAIAIFGGLMRVGVFIGPVIGGFIGAYLGLRSVFLLNALLIISALVALFTLMPNRSQAETKAARAVHHHSLLRTMRQHAHVLRAAGLGQILAMLTRYGRMVIIPLYAAEELGLGVEYIGLIESFSYGLDMMFFYPGRLGDGSPRAKIRHHPLLRHAGCGPGADPADGIGRRDSLRGGATGNWQRHRLRDDDDVGLRPSAGQCPWRFPGRLALHRRFRHGRRAAFGGEYGRPVHAGRLGAAARCGQPLGSGDLRLLRAGDVKAETVGAGRFVIPLRRVHLLRYTQR